MALGAGFGDIAKLIYRDVLAPSALGLGIGIAVAFWLTHLLRALLFGVSEYDPATLAGCGAALLLIAVAAATGPALRASGADPASVLHGE